MKEQQLPSGQRQEWVSQTEELRLLKAELKRVTEERDILKRPPRTLPSRPHARALTAVCVAMG